MGVNWGSVPDWLAGAGAVGALVFAAIAAVATRRTNQMQSTQIAHLEQENRERAHEKRRDLASKVAVYISIHRGAEGKHTVRFYNGGALPIYGLRIICFTPKGAPEQGFFVNGPHPEGVVMQRLTGQVRELVGPTGLVDFDSQNALAAACSFRDAAGLWWYRTALGELHEAPSDEIARQAARASGVELGLRHEASAPESAS